MITIETFFYVAPNLTCEECTAVIPLPYPDLPQTSHDQWCAGEYTSPMETLPDEWSAIFGCRECGHVGTYPGWHVGDWLVEKENQGKFHNKTNCFSVGLQCAKVECKAPATLHAHLRDKEVEKDLMRLLKTSFYDGELPCGHAIMPIPDRYYVDLRRVLTRLW